MPEPNEQIYNRELDNQARLMRMRQLQESHGDPEEAANLRAVSHPEANATYDSLTAMPYIPNPDEDARQRYLRWLSGANREDGDNNIADDVDNLRTANGRVILPGDMPAQKFYPVAEGVREWTRSTRNELSIEAVRSATSGTGFWRQTLSRIMGSTAAQVMQGGVEPLARAQQVLYGALRGEGSAAFSRLFPRVVLENRTDPETGLPLEMSPWAATIDTAWAKLRGDDEAYRENLQILRETNALYSSDPQLLEFSDVVDGFMGKDYSHNMDAFYEDLYDAGFMGKVGMGALSLAYAAGEVFADPLIIFDFVPGVVNKGVKAFASTATIAEKSAKVARKTRNLPDTVEALRAASKHLDAAHAEHLRAPSHATETNLRNAMNLYGEQVDNIEWFKRNPIEEGGDQFDLIHHTGVGKRNPSTIEGAAELMEEADQIIGSANSWERGLQYDVERGMWIDVQSRNKPVQQFRKQTGKTHKIEAAGEDAVGMHGPLLQSLEAFAEKLGVRVLPFQSSGHKTKSLMLKGQYWPGSRTIWLNTVGKDAHQITTTFFHEAWHHIFYSYMTLERKGDLIEAMGRAGFDFTKYADAAKALDYNFGGMVDLADEFSARSLSNMAIDPEFWDTLRKLDPEAFEQLSKKAEDLAIASMYHVDRVGGMTPRRWLDNDLNGKPVNYDHPTGATGWEEHTRNVMGAIDHAYKQDPKLLAKHRERITREVNEAIDGMRKNREGLQAQGRKTPLLDKEIARAEKYVKRLEARGNVSRLADFKFKYEMLRQRSPEEMRQLLQAERKMAAIRNTESIQPNRIPTWAKNADGEWTKGVWEQQDIFDGTAADRIALGPDDAEYAAEGLARLVHGADVDDFLAPSNLVPERHAQTGGRIVPGTKRNMIDLDQIRKTTWEAKQRAKRLNLELWEYDSGAAFLDEALNAAKEAKPPKKFKGKTAKTLDELDAMPADKPVKYADQPYDEAWLPKPRKRNEDLMAEGWWDNHQRNAFDRIATGLYPKTWRVRYPAHLRGFFMHMREPMRVLEEVDPGKSWPLIRGAMYNAESETQRLQSVFQDAMERFGALSVKNPGNLRKVWTSGQRPKTTTNAELSELLFEILDTSTKESKYAKLTADLTADQRKAVSDIRHELDLIADRLGIRGTDAFIDGYIHHAFDPKDYANGNILPETAGMSKSGQVFLGALLKRNGRQGYTKDAVAALEVYARGVPRKLHMEPALKQLKQRAKWYANRPGGKDKWFERYVDMVIAQINGEPSHMGRVVDNVMLNAVPGYRRGDFGRGVLAMNNLIYTSLLAGNRRYPIMSIATALSTTSAKYGMFRTVKAMFKMATPEGQLLYKHMGITRQFNLIFESDLMSKVGKITQGMSDLRPLTLSTQDTEQFIRGMTFWASLDDNLTKMGFSNFRFADEAGFGQELMFEAMRQTENINHHFGVLGKTPWLGRMSKSGSALGTQFLSFPFKQSETLLELAKDDPGNIVRFMMASGWVARVAAQELGMDVQEYVGLDAARPKLSQLESPGVALLGSMVRAMATLSDVESGYATAEDAKAAVDQFLKDTEVLVPGMRLAREFAQAAEMDVTGRKETPGLGMGRNVDADYVNMGDRVSFPIPSGAKGERNEIPSIAAGSRSIQETMNQRAKARVRQVVNEAAIERMALVEQAKQAMDSGDWTEVQKQLQRMAEAGLPIGDITDPIRAQQELRILDWHITQMKNNPSLIPQVVNILKEYGILEGQNNAQDQR